MKTLALIERGKDGSYGVYTANLTTTLWGEGETVAEAKASLENALKEIIQFAKEDGEEIPSELRDLEFEYKYDIASLFNYYSFINVSKFAEIVGINPSLMRQYKQGNTYISEAQTNKIQTALNALGKELQAVQL